MKVKHSSKKVLSVFLCMVLVVAMALFTTGCNGNTEKENGNKQETGKETESASEENGETAQEGAVLGNGETKFIFSATDAEGQETVYEIHTDKETVGEALMELGLIEGEEGPYGLYVKTVSGVTADYDTDGTYWAFYVNEEYAAAGVDATPVTDGDTYSFKVEK